MSVARISLTQPISSPSLPTTRMPTWMYCGSTLMCPVYPSDSQGRQNALAEQLDTARRVDPVRRAKFDAGGAASAQPLDLAHDVVRAAGECEAVEHLVRDIPGHGRIVTPTGSSRDPS